MKRKQGYQVVPFSAQRQAVAASATVGRERNNIHTFTEVDIATPRRLIREHGERTGERLSLTAYVVACLARTIAEYPAFNAFRKGRKLVLLDDVTVGVLVERTIAGEGVPEILTIQAADTKTYQQINDEIRAAQQQGDVPFGTLSGSTWIMRLIPGFLLTQFIRLAARNIRIARRYGVVGVTAVGMFGPSPMWIVPLSGATVAVAVGSIVERPVCIDGALEAREHLCLTLSFDHDIIDGAPAARFTKQFAALLMSGEMLHEACGPQSTDCRA
ncbi:MAG: 2-oxo acid dehydrogenase subunit E2 [Chloroflexi bacterium]|nr:2-oxo acid dehydrogenase subunit E2 [Chloroflexota bacterium]